MGNTPTNENKNLKTVEEIINFGVMKATAPAVIKMVKAIPSLSFLNIWPLSAIFSYLVNWIAEKFSVMFQYVGVKVIISIQTNRELSHYSAAEVELRSALLSGDKNAITLASEKFDQALGDLIRWDGSAPVIK